MRAVVQRVSEAQVEVDGELVGRVEPGAPGLLVLLGAGKGDGDADADFLADKICGLRIFEDGGGKMNLSLEDVGGSLLVVSQFTLYGDCRKGRRPSFVDALEPVAAARLVERFVARARTHLRSVETGRFQAHMVVSLVNDGPVTLILESR
ncbi:MAG: D-tyrosyl-tRNA(Tyr) deacylase [Myxococcales bacterium]|nr:D-tyrosyl-tRNA(Tyr) deacylase [Myxococcales bacterium]